MYRLFMICQEWGRICRITWHILLIFTLTTLILLLLIGPPQWSIYYLGMDSWVEQVCPHSYWTNNFWLIYFRNFGGDRLHKQQIQRPEPGSSGSAILFRWFFGKLRQNRNGGRENRQQPPANPNHTDGTAPKIARRNSIKGQQRPQSSNDFRQLPVPFRWRQSFDRRN